MERLKCSVCGAELIQESKTKYVCPYCDNFFTVKEEIPQETVILMNIANLELQNKAFSRARKAYEKIIACGTEISEVYWCNVLCKYGIEYIKDSDGKYLPTCHRINVKSVFEDPDYLLALKYAENKSEYESKAYEIEKIRKEILEKTKTVEKYEVFICYKQEDNGKPTAESLFATDIYNRLKGLGVKVFLARKCIPAGESYEPYIYNALETSKIMLVMCADEKYVESTWVANEWERFIDKMNIDSSRKLIPVFDGFDPYKLPEGLDKLRLQGLQRGDLDFADRLITAVEKTLGRELRKEKSKEEINALNSDKISKLKKGEVALRLKNYEKAKEHYENFVEEYPDDFRGWMGIIRVCTRNYTDYFADNYDDFKKFALESANETEKSIVLNEIREYEAERAKAESKLAEEKRKEEEEKRKKAEEERIRAEEEKRKEEERRKAEEERLRVAEAENKRREENRKLEEERRKAEEARRKEEERRKAEEEKRKKTEEERRRREEQARADRINRERKDDESLFGGLFDSRKNNKNDEFENIFTDLRSTDNSAKRNTDNSTKRNIDNSAKMNTEDSAKRNIDNNKNSATNARRIRNLFDDDVREKENRRISDLFNDNDAHKNSSAYNNRVAEAMKMFEEDQPKNSVKSEVYNFFESDEKPKDRQKEISEKMRKFFEED